MNYIPRSKLLPTDTIRKDVDPFVKKPFPWVLVAAGGAALVWIFVLLKRRK